MNKYQNKTLILLVTVFTFLFSCTNNSAEKKAKKINYPKLTKKVKKDSTSLISDSSNIFDGNEFDPTKDSLDKILGLLEKEFMEDSAQIVLTGVDSNGVLNNIGAVDSLQLYVENGIIKKEIFTNDLKKINEGELKTLKYNLEQLKQKPTVAEDPSISKTQIDARVWARVSKKTQLLKLYIDGNLVDSFKVSTGDKKHETPTLDQRPSGPIFNKYTSKKFPGGNYNGLGNMPYVVFVQGGYALHGTTQGNIPKLGKKASHGCVRLHPDNAKIFNEVVKAVGIENTWITITENE
jgi:hypothetical protein